MNRSRRIFRWSVFLAVIASAGLSLWRSAVRQSQIDGELANTNREAARISSLLLRSRERAQEQAEVLATVTASVKTTPTTRKETRTRELLAVIDQIPAEQKLESRPPAPSGPSGNVYFPELMDVPGYRENVRAFFRHQIQLRYGPWLQSIPSPEVRTVAEKLLVDERVNEQQPKAHEPGAAGLGSQSRSEMDRQKMQLYAAGRLEFRQILGEEEHARYLAFSASLIARD